MSVLRWAAGFLARDTLFRMPVRDGLAGVARAADGAQPPV